MPMPNFLIIGAGRSGTTSLYNYLKQHPEIYMSPVKEPGFFALEGKKLDFRGPGAKRRMRSMITDIEAYRSLFKGVSNEKAIGEATAYYLYMTKAAERIKHYIPNAKLIAILRNPVDRAYSGYMMNVYNGNEKFDFAKALQIENVRIHNRTVFGYYTSTGFYYKQLKYYFKIFNHYQIRIYLYEDLQTDSIGLVQDIFQFLGVDDKFIPDISIKHNVSGIPKSKFLNTLMSGRNPFTIILEPLKPFIPASLIKAIYRLKSQNLINPPLSLQIRRQVIEMYKEDISKLQILIHRDLSRWLE